jgi:hypothetical protein
VFFSFALQRYGLLLVPANFSTIIFQKKFHFFEYDTVKIASTTYTPMHYITPRKTNFFCSLLLLLVLLMKP